jgi:integrase
MPLPPYTKAHLVNAHKPVTERWYIVFWAWNALTGKKVRKRCYLVNNQKTKATRLAFAAKRIAAINDLLEGGYHFNPKKKKSQQVALYTEKSRVYTISEAFKFILPVIKNSKRGATHNSYNSIANLFQQFCEDAGWIDWKIDTLEKTDIISFLDYIQAPRVDADNKMIKGVSNTTRNKYKDYLGAIFTLLIERGKMKTNVAHGIKKLREDEGGNTAYLPEQIEVLKEAITAKNNRLWLFITFMLYGFIRPAEIGRLKVKMIDLNGNMIRMPGSITKNGYDRNVRISQHFKAYLAELDLPKYSPEHYVFGYNLVTGPKPVQKNQANLMHNRIARALGFGGEYTLYSWKHTGVVLHYRKGIDIKTLQAQIGHRSIQETDTYLKSLGLYENTEIEDKSPAI